MIGESYRWVLELCTNMVLFHFSLSAKMAQPNPCVTYASKDYLKCAHEKIALFLVATSKYQQNLHLERSQQSRLLYQQSLRGTNKRFQKKKKEKKKHCCSFPATIDGID